MDSELRKAAQAFADSIDGYENDLPLSAIRAKGALRAALAKNANAASQEKGIRDILRDTVRSIIAAHSDGDLDVPLAIADLRAALAKNANDAPDSSLAPLIESLIGEYCDIAYEEGKTGISQGDLANQVLGRIRNALIAWSQRAAPQDQYAKDAARYRMARFKGTISDEWQESLDHWIALDAALAAMEQKP